MAGTSTQSAGLQHADSAALIKRADTRHVVHGFSTFDYLEPGPVLRSAMGCRLFDVDGLEWVDAAAGQANVALGYGRSDLVEAISSALSELSYGTHFYQRRSHVYAAQLAEELSQLTPGNISQFFFGVGGSDAVETAIKLARFANIVSGRRNKIHIIGRWQSYHGVSYGAASLSGDPAMWANIGPRLEGFSHVQQPTAENAQVAVAALEAEIIRVGPENVAAFIAEPIATPTGLVIPHDQYWPQVRELCTRYGILLIVDEVLTGFGRTGKLFASENWSLEPDIMTMSKALTNGYFPLSAVGITPEVRAMLSVGGHKLAHGVTYAAHPGGCAAALAVLDIYQRENVLARSLESSAYLESRLRSVAAAYPVLKKDSVRALGMMLAVDIDADYAGEGFGASLHRQIFKERLILRTYRNDQTIGFLPVLTSTREDVDEIIRRLQLALEAFKS